MKKLPVVLMALALVFCLTGLVRAEEYNIDVFHSQVLFKVKHLGISTVTGRFDKFSGTFHFDPKNVKASKGNVKIDASSVNTNVERRDNHLRSGDFLDAAKYPEITFVSTKVGVMKKNKFRVHGNLTLHGVTKPAILDVEYGGSLKDQRGDQRAAFSASTRINRKDYGLIWSRLTEAGGMMVGDQVQIILEIEAVTKRS